MPTPDISKFLNQPGSTLSRRGAKRGNKFGIELELEGPGVRLNAVDTIKGWTKAEDPSLRGDSVEYVFTQPYEYESAVEHVKQLFALFEKNKVKIVNSYRTSTHVHLNFSDKPLQAMINFFALHTMFEEILEHFAGEYRSGNLFCLSARMSEAVVDTLTHSIRTADFRAFRDDRLKYAACNLCTMYKFGSVEVRSMRGAKTAEEIIAWLGIINDLYLYSLKMVSPTEIIEALSQQGADGLFNSVFSANSRMALHRTLPPVDFNLFASLMEGARLIQPLAYEFDAEFKKKKVFKVPEETKIGKEIQDVQIYTRGGGAWNIHTRNGVDIDDERYVYHPNVDRMWDAEREVYVWWRSHPVFGNEAVQYRANNGVCTVDVAQILFDQLHPEAVVLAAPPAPAPRQAARGRRGGAAGAQNHGFIVDDPLQDFLNNVARREREGE